MDHQRLAAIEFGQEIFGPAPQAADCPARQALRKMGRKRHAQIMPANDRMRNHMALQRRGKTQADGFDFGQFRHARNS